MYAEREVQLSIDSKQNALVYTDVVLVVSINSTLANILEFLDSSELLALFKEHVGLETREGVPLSGETKIGDLMSPEENQCEIVINRREGSLPDDL